MPQLHITGCVCKHTRTVAGDRCTTCHLSVVPRFDLGGRSVRDGDELEVRLLDAWARVRFHVPPAALVLLNPAQDAVVESRPEAPRALLHLYLGRRDRPRFVPMALPFAAALDQSGQPLPSPVAGRSWVVFDERERVVVHDAARRADADRRIFFDISIEQPFSSTQAEAQDLADDLDEHYADRPALVVPVFDVAALDLRWPGGA